MSMNRIQQLALFPTVLDEGKGELVRVAFSHNAECQETARQALEQQYGYLLEETDKFNRQLVSFQANKAETLHDWMKYREGFSAELVEKLLDEFQVKPGDAVLDPFAGSATTLAVAKMMGIDATGIELLPNCQLAWKAKSLVFDYDPAELRRLRQLVATITPKIANRPFPHLKITESAFMPQTEVDLMAYTDWLGSLDLHENTKLLCAFILMSILEEVSLTRKDGQYLRWDSRADKLRTRNLLRESGGKQPIEGIDKGNIPSVRDVFIRQIDKIIADVANLQSQSTSPGCQRLIEGSALDLLPTLNNDQFAAVITSPPYANRYDYTRTYALELAYLGVGDDIFRLRQELLSCTVENRPKLEPLAKKYEAQGRADHYRRVMSVVENNAALAEIDDALQRRYQRGEVNNAGVLTMVKQYFTELTFVYSELFRVCRPGAMVAFINDNVRYAGEIIPVDLLCTELATTCGFEPVKVYVLPQRKGNSSQQMSRFGREPLRKSITIWRKPVNAKRHVPLRWTEARAGSETTLLPLNESRPEWSFVDDLELRQIQSTQDEVRRAVERNAIERGILFAEIIVETNIDSLIKQVEDLARSIDQEDIREQTVQLGIDARALDLLDDEHPPIPYGYYFCTRETLQSLPKLCYYYRNIAMLPDKVMRDIGLPTSGIENGFAPAAERASEIAVHFNRVVSGLLTRTGVSSHRHIQMLMANLGDSLGGSSRNEVGRVAMALVLRPLIEGLWRRGYLESITFSVRESLIPGRGRDKEQTVIISPDLDLEAVLVDAETKFVKYQKVQSKSGVSMLVDKQIRWRDKTGKTFEASSDLHSLRHAGATDTDVLWGAEVKGGADPAGSDEHWKTASTALARAIEAAKQSDHPQPPLSFIGTTIVQTVALEIKAWIERGDLVSAYNLTKIIEQPDYRQSFVEDVLVFMGYDS
jgi:site-specific DNA-methyltransferase (cytosine-N4-specific)